MSQKNKDRIREIFNNDVELYISVTEKLFNCYDFCKRRG
jgi:hypothetical protein